MSENNAIPTRAELEAKLAERAWTDDAFRAELQRDPAATIRRALDAYGLVLPEGVTVHLHEETPTELHLVLPHDFSNADLALDDEALDLVAGGASGEINNDGNKHRIDCV